MSRPRSDIRPRLLEAALHEFLARGVDGASLRAIARRARTNIGMIYYYFPTKDDLFLAVVEQHYEPMLQGLRDAVDVAAPVEERLRRLFVRIGRASEQELDIFRLVLREVMTSSERIPRLIERFKRGHLALLSEVVASGMAEGGLTTQHHPALLVMSTFAIGTAPQMLRRFAGEHFPFGDVPGGEQMATELARIVMNGIARRPEESS